MRLAYFSPLPPQKSGIADYSIELLPQLAKLTDLTVFTSDPSINNDSLKEYADIRDIKQFSQQAGRYDLPLYHIGNSEHHDYIIGLALRHPGVIVLHDFYLHHSGALRTIGTGDPTAYAREAGYELGAEGVRRALSLKYGSGAALDMLPLNRRLLDSSLGVIVHSRYAAVLVRRQRYEGPLAVIPQPVKFHSTNSRRAELGIPDDAVLFGSFGLQTKEKQIVETLHAINSLRRQGLEAHFLLVGEALPEVPVESLVGDLGLERAVHYLGFVSELSEFVDWIQTSDAVINLRNPTRGETSASALRAMAAGKPLIVHDHGWYSEIPDEAALKIPVEDDNALLDAMRLIGTSSALRQKMGQAGQVYIEEQGRPEHAASSYVRELNRLQRNSRIYG